MKKIAVKVKMTRGDDTFSTAVSIVQGELSSLINYLEILHEEEKTRYETFKFDPRRISYLLGRFSAKYAIGHLTDVNIPEEIYIGSGVFEFPVVTHDALSNVQVSISHCGPIGISIAFEEIHPMGIDIEKISDKKKSTILSQITDKEKELLRNTAMDTIEGYTAVWCAKESLAKIIKTGMMLDFALLEIDSITIKNDCLESTFRYFGQYKAMSHINKKYAISIVLPQRTEANFNGVWQAFDSISAIEKC